MKLLNNVIYLELDDAIACGLGNANYITKERSRGAKWARFMDDPDDLRRMLIEYESLRPGKKEQVQRKYGNVYEHVAKEPIRKLVKRDLKANEFFLQYRFEGEKCLPIEHVQKYTAAAEWLNMLLEVGEDKKALKKLLNLSIADFWAKVCEVIQDDKIDLPASYRRLTEKARQYKGGGYASLIHGAFGNSSALKVSTEPAQAMLLEMIAHHNQYDDVWVALAYNQWAKMNGVKEIHPATVANWRRDNEHLIIAQREGNSALNEKYLRQSKGHRPSAPLYLVEHDDNNLDFLFLDPNDPTQHKYYHKYVAICVTDSSCDLLLGKCYKKADSPTKDMVRGAYIDAMYYIRSITGSWHLPFEVKGDRWASKDLYPFYGSMGNFVPPSHGNKHRGYIEQFFKAPIWKRAQKIGNDNWSGNNISAKYRGVNMEMLDINKQLRTHVGNEAEQQIENFFQRLRHIPDVTRNNFTNALTKEQQWLAKWNDLREDQKRPISDLQFLSIFGITHNPDRPVAITNRGVEVQITNWKYSYDLPESLQLSRFVGAKVNVVYDPYDMSRVLVTNGDDIRFIAREARLQPRALEDQRCESRTYLNAILREKKEQVQAGADAAEKRRRVLRRSGYSAEAALQGGVMIKELKNQAEHAYQLPVNSTFSNDIEEYDPLDDM